MDLSENENHTAFPKRLGNLLRTQEWLDYKIAPLFLPLYLVLSEDSAAPREGIATFFALLCYFLVTASLGYFLNDLGDIETDRLAGKRNRVAGLGRIGRIGMLSILSFLSLGSAFILFPSRAFLTLAGIEVLCFLVYSFKPFRCKERPVGILVDMLYAHLIPFSLSVIASAGFAKSDFSEILTVALLWQGVQGLRHILAHQLRDYEADRRSGVHTFVVRFGPAFARLIQGRVLPLVECLLLGGLILSLPGGWPLGILALVFFCLTLKNCLLVKARGYQFSHDVFLSDRFLNNFSITWIPYYFLSLLTLQHWQYSSLLLIQFLFLGRPKIDRPPSPPSWEFVCRRAVGDDAVAVEGWTLRKDYLPLAVELTVDGWPVGTLYPSSATQAIQDCYAQPQGNFIFFHGCLPIARSSQLRKRVELRLYGVSEDGQRMLIQSDDLDVETAPLISERREWETVFERDIPKSTARGLNSFPCKILVLDFFDSLREYTYDSIAPAMGAQGFEILRFDTGDDFLHACESGGKGSTVAFLPGNQVDDMLRETARKGGYLIVAFAPESEEAPFAPLSRKYLDFLGTFSTPVFERFAARYLGIFPILRKDAETRAFGT